MDYLEKYLKIVNLPSKLLYLIKITNKSDVLYLILKLNHEINNFIKKFEDLLAETKENGHYV